MLSTTVKCYQEKMFYVKVKKFYVKVFLRKHFYVKWILLLDIMDTFYDKVDSG
jgi:hypothetical protein